MADKDTDYYYTGFTNPNTKEKMYWKDSINVLQDLDQFQSLHVKYHGCVWTKYGSRYGSGENYDVGETDDAVGVTQAQNNGCGGDGGEYFWYLGRTHCFRANVAYSLYGILKNTDSNNNACSKKTYINSFFTRFGVETFGGPLGLGVDEANSYCTTEDPADDANIYYEDASFNDDYLDDDQQFLNYQVYSSYGTGCAAGKFVIDRYQGAFCNGADFVEQVDTLDDFNAAIESQECTQIYNADNQGRHKLSEASGSKLSERKLGEDDDSIDFEDLDSIAVLRLSRACSIKQYPHDCPDPYGKLKKYTKALDWALANGGLAKSPKEKAVKAASGIFFGLGAIFMAVAFWITRKTQRKPVNSEQGNYSSSQQPRKFTTPSVMVKDRSDATSDDDEAAPAPPDSPLQKISDLSQQAVMAVSGAALAAKASFQEFAESEISPPASPARSSASSSSAASNNGTTTDATTTSAAGTGPSVFAPTAAVIQEEEPAATTTTTKTKRPKLAAFSKKLFGSKKGKV